MSYTYDAFGNVLSQEGEGSNPYQFSTKEYNPDTGLVYFGARYYDPTIGRFISQDPLGMVDGVNLYVYVNNNPVNWVDPWGLCGENRVNWRTIGIGTLEVIGGIGTVKAGLAFSVATTGTGSLIGGIATKQGVLLIGMGIADIIGGLYGEEPFIPSLKGRLLDNPLVYRWIIISNDYF